MSLVLSIFDSQHATVVSDGRSTHLRETGEPEIMGSDVRKVFRTRSNQVFAMTGQANLCDELRNNLASFGGTMVELVSIVRDFVRNCKPEPRPSQVGQISVVVFGRSVDGAMSSFDIGRQNDEITENFYSTPPGCCQFLAIGFTKKPALELDRAADLIGFVPSTAWAGFLSKILEQIAANHEVVGGTAYVETL